MLFTNSLEMIYVSLAAKLKKDSITPWVDNTWNFIFEQAWFKDHRCKIHWNSSSGFRRHTLLTLCFQHWRCFNIHSRGIHCDLAIHRVMPAVAYTTIFMPRLVYADKISPSLYVTVSYHFCKRSRENREGDYRNTSCCYMWGINGYIAVAVENNFSPYMSSFLDLK